MTPSPSVGTLLNLCIFLQLTHRIDAYSAEVPSSQARDPTIADSNRASEVSLYAAVWVFFCAEADAMAERKREGRGRCRGDGRYGG